MEPGNAFLQNMIYLLVKIYSDTFNISQIITVYSV